jgi:RNA polymerase sigma-70 factor (ECF subfamily)
VSEHPGDPAPTFQRERGRLFALAYRMLGSVGEAEDVVQEAFLRWHAQPRGDIESPPAFLTTITTRLCLDVLKSARRQRETYPGVWLPEPLADGDVDAWPGTAAASPEDDLRRLEALSFAFMSLLERLSPVERAVYLLVEVLDHSHAEAGAILQRSADSCRQALSRAKQALAEGKRANAPPQRHHEMLVAFLLACQKGDADGIAQLLADDVESRADGGGYVTAATKPVVGVRAVSRLFAGLSSLLPPDLQAQPAVVNGWPTALLSSQGVLLAALQIHVVDGRIARIDDVLSPPKLARLAAARGLRTSLPPAGT